MSSLFKWHNFSVQILGKFLFQRKHYSNIECCFVTLAMISFVFLKLFACPLFINILRDPYRPILLGGKVVCPLVSGLRKFTKAYILIQSAKQLCVVNRSYSAVGFWLRFAYVGLVFSHRK